MAGEKTNVNKYSKEKNTHTHTQFNCHDKMHNGETSARAENFLGSDISLLRRREISFDLF